MNDFTKKELVSSLECLKLYGDSFFCGLSAYETVIDKLQSMIDNYCEHEWGYNQHEQGRCIKCGINR